MTEQETAKILAILGVAFQHFTVDKLKVTLWHKMLGDLEYPLVEAATEKLLLESPFPPTIHDLRKRTIEARHPAIPTPAEAWGEVAKNIACYGRYRVKEGMAVLSPVAQETVRYIGYVEICNGESAIIRAQFMRMYEQLLNCHKEKQLLPHGLQERLRLLASPVDDPTFAKYNGLLELVR